MCAENGIYVVNVDMEATRHVYARLPALPCESACEANYVEAVRYAPLEISGFLNALGVDIAKPAAMSAGRPRPSGQILYEGCFFVVGELMEARHAMAGAMDTQCVFHLGDATACFAPEDRTPVQLFGAPMVQLDVSLWLPWLMEGRGAALGYA